MTLSNPRPQSITAYDQDFYTWTQQMAHALRHHDWAALDITNLAEEIEDLGKGERCALKSRLEVLIMHLLKWHHQPQQRTNSWKSTIIAHRLRIQDLLTDSPSLKPYLKDILPQSYSNAKQLAAAETGLPLDTFPPHCPHTIEQILGSGFLP